MLSNARFFFCLCALLAASCPAARSPSPEDAVGNLYRFLIDSRVSGAPTAAELAAMRPYVSAELHDLLAEARKLCEAEAAAHPDEKPPFVEGDLFTSLFEGPTGFAILGGESGAAGQSFAVRFTDERETPAVEWTDTVVVRAEAGRPVVADVRYGGTWDFANRGSLVESLAFAVRPASPAAWVLRFDGIGAVRVGMPIAEVERMLGESARLERIEPGDRCGYAYFSALPAGIALMLDGEAVVRADVSAAGILTEAGAGVGSTESDVLGLYRGMVRVEPHPYTGPEGHYLIVDDPGRPGLRMIFETDGKAVTSMRAGRLPEVGLIEGCA